MSDTLNSKVQEWESLVEISHEIVHGGPTNSVMTEGGEVKSFAKVIADFEEKSSTAINDNMATLEARKELALTVDIPAAIATVAAIENRGDWTATVRNYALKDIVQFGGTWYICVAQHSTSAMSVFATDALTKWRVYQGIVQPELDSAIAISNVGGLGDFSPDGALVIACGDSTTEQFNANNGGSEQIVKLRQLGEVWGKLVGFVNFGGSGYTLAGFVNDVVGTLPTSPTTGVAAVSNWDYYGHKPTGAISQATALAWRVGKADRALWRICYGINDLILYAATGNLSQSAITDYLAPLLRTAIQRILTAYPRDSIVLEIPNPMTARPYVSTAGFPSATAYPAFGSVLADDQALVEKWNQALRATYGAKRVPKNEIDRLMD